jgi:hypothetical protein
MKLSTCPGVQVKYSIQRLGFRASPSSCCTCCNLFSLFSGHFQNLPATPCNMNATWNTICRPVGRTSRTLSYDWMSNGYLSFNACPQDAADCLRYRLLPGRKYLFGICVYLLTNNALRPAGTQPHCGGCLVRISNGCRSLASLSPRKRLASSPTSNSLTADGRHVVCAAA